MAHNSCLRGSTLFARGPIAPFTSSSTSLTGSVCAPVHAQCDSAPSASRAGYVTAPSIPETSVWVKGTAQYASHRRGGRLQASSTPEPGLADTAVAGGRRSTLLLLAATALGLQHTLPATAEPPLKGATPVPAALFDAQPDPTLFSYNFASDTPLNLKPREYWLTIVRTRPPAWQLIARSIQDGKYEALGLQLTQLPFADMRTACLYLPWSLLQCDEYEAAVSARKAYVAFDNHVQDLQKVALAAADGRAEPAQVQQAFILLNASLEGFLQTVPAKYQQATRSERTAEQ